VGAKEHEDWAPCVVSKAERLFDEMPDLSSSFARCVSEVLASCNAPFDGAELLIPERNVCCKTLSMNVRVLQSQRQTTINGRIAWF